MSKRRRKMRAVERARQDQRAAAWCDCPDDSGSPHYSGDPAYVCGGCPTDAVYVMHVMHGTTDQINYPVCVRHRSNLTTTVSGMFTGVPVEFHTMSVLDDEDDDTVPGGEPR